MKSRTGSGKPRLNTKALAKHKRRFLRFFPNAFADQRYIDWERTYKWEAHKLWKDLLSRSEFERLMLQGEHQEIARRALLVESRCNFLFSFEKMALRDGVQEHSGARAFSEGLYQLLYSKGALKQSFPSWIMSVAELPRKKSRVLSWPVLTFFPFIAQPSKHMILKPAATRVAAAELEFDFDYSSKPSFRTYRSLLDFAHLIEEGISDLKPVDYHDLQSFLWTVGSSEYERLEAELD